MPPQESSTAQRVLAIIGLVAILISIWLAFQSPFGLWHWVLLLVALGCMFGSRRLGK